jgi:hypothetical protein
MIAPRECPRVPQPVGNDEDPGWRQGRLIHVVDDEAQEHLIITSPSSEIAPAASTATAIRVRFGRRTARRRGRGKVMGTAAPATQLAGPGSYVEGAGDGGGRSGRSSSCSRRRWPQPGHNNGPSRLVEETISAGQRGAPGRNRTCDMRDEACGELARIDVGSAESLQRLRTFMRNGMMPLSSE